MATRKNRSDDERHYQSEFVKAFKAYSDFNKRKVFIDVDEDTPMRVIKSGYDFSISRNGKVIFIETKVSTAKTENYNIFNKLEEYQKITMTEVLMSNGCYAVLEWNYKKANFILYLLTPRASGQIHRVRKEGSVEIMRTLLDWLEC